MIVVMVEKKVKAWMIDGQCQKWINSGCKIVGARGCRWCQCSGVLEE